MTGKESYYLLRVFQKPFDVVIVASSSSWRVNGKGNACLILYAYSLVLCCIYSSELSKGDFMFFCVYIMWVTYTQRKRDL